MKTRLYCLVIAFVTVAAIGQLNISNPFFVAGVLKPAAGGGASLEVVQAAKAAAVATSAAVTISPTAANLLVVGIVGYTGDDANHTVSDNIDGTTGWTLVHRTNDSASANISLWYKKNIPSGITTITCTGGASTTSTIGFAHEVSGASTSTPFTSGEMIGGNEEGQTTWGPGNVNNATAASVLFGLFGCEDVGGNPNTTTLNGAGTDGTWVYEDATNSKELSGVSYIAIGSMPNIVVSTTGNKAHVWGTLNSAKAGTAIVATFH